MCHPLDRCLALDFRGHYLTLLLRCSLAAEGMTFTAWYSAWHCCSASRAAMLTGRLPPRTGVDSVGSGVFTAAAIGGLPRNETTFAELLGPAGFATAMLGKWQ